MTLRQLRFFMAVAQTSNFAAASERMHVSQPALSLAIKGLEESLGGRLLERTTRSVALTPEGRTLYEKAKRMLSEWDRMEEEMRQRFALERGTVSIASMPSFAANVMPDIIAAFRAKHPDINVHVDDVVAEETVARVRSGEVELGVTFRPLGLTEEDDFTCLCVDEFVAILPMDHILSEQSSLCWSQLMGESFIALQQPSMVRGLVESCLTRADLSLEVSFDSHQLATVGRMVSKGLGVSVVPSLCAPQMEQLGAKVLPIGEPRIASDLGVLRQRGVHLSAPAQALYDALLTHYLELDSAE